MFNKDMITQQTARPVFTSSGCIILETRPSEQTIIKPRCLFNLVNSLHLHSLYYYLHYFTIPLAHRPLPLPLRHLAFRAILVTPIT